MTGAEAIKRNEKSQALKVWQVDDTWFYVESEDGKIAYKCCLSDQGDYCNCGDFATRSKNDPQFKCKHLLAVMNSIPRNEILDAQFLEKRKPKLDERFIKQIEGRDFALYSGLLDLAHQKNLASMEVELIQRPTTENEQTAICKAIARTANGGIFIDVGDANPKNCNSKVVRHIIRMASTRAKARCLRDLTNIGMTCLEELGDITEVSGLEDEAGKAVAPKRENVRKFTPKQSVQKPSDDQTKPDTKADPEPQESMPAAASTVQASVQTAPQEVQAPVNETKPEAVTKPPVRETRASAKVKSGNGNGKIPMMSEAQKSAIYNLSRRRGISVDELENMAMTTFNMPVENLTHENAVAFIRTLQQAA